jgi:hypothetical protein
VHQLKIVTSSNDPILARDEPACTYRDIRDVECPQQQLRVIVVYVDFAIVQGTQDPILGGMKVDCLDTIGATRQEFLDLCSLDLKSQSA